MNHIVMILSNGFAPDCRVAREMKSLSQQGYQISLIAWDRRKEFQAYEEINSIRIYRIHTSSSEYTVGWKQLFHITRFWKRAIQKARDLNPDYIHCHDLDTLYVGYRLKKQLACKLVFDAHEHYPAQMTLYLPELFIYGLGYWQKWLLGAIDAVITASTVLGDEIKGRLHKPVVTVGNYQPLEPFEQVDELSIRRNRMELGVDEDRLCVAYIGGFTKNRALEPFIRSAGYLPHVHYHLWGDGPQRVAVEDWSHNYENVFYHGWLSPEKIPLYFKSMDIIYYALKPDYAGAPYNAPNTLTQAMAAGRPVIANDIGDLGRIIKDTGCGLILEKLGPVNIADAVKLLQNDRVRSEIGRKGLAAARNYYHADTAGKMLVNLYRDLI
jgi:glycosyltransferase involved in cell wall biosynthesis